MITSFAVMYLFNSISKIKIFIKFLTFSDKINIQNNGNEKPNAIKAIKHFKCAYSKL